MKRILLLSFFLIFLIGLILSCAKSTTETDSFPSAEDFFFKIYYYMNFESLGEKSVNIRLFSKDSVYTSELIINDIEIPLSFELYLFEDFFFPWNAVVDSNSVLNELNSGDTVSYSLSINNNTFTGTLVIIYDLDVNWLETFNPDIDYTFNWTIEEDPYIQFCNFWISDGYDNDDEYRWEINGSKREYTIKKKYFYDDWIDVDIDLYGYNYINHGKCFVFSYSGDYKNYYKYSKKHDNQKTKLEKRIRERFYNLLNFLSLDYL